MNKTVFQWSSIIAFLAVMTSPIFFLDGMFKSDVKLTVAMGYIVVLALIYLCLSKIQEKRQKRND